MIELKDHSKDITIEFFSQYGEQLLQAVYFKDLISWYGPLFLQWYNTVRKGGRS